jgi:hypothetical protein
MTMQPWGLFESESAFRRADLTGDITWKQARTMLSEAREEIAKGDVVQLRAAPLFNEPFLIARHRDGSETRLGADGKPAALDATAFSQAVETTRTSLAGARVETITREDSYYYSHHNKVALPAIRVTLADKDSTRVYLNASTGEIARVADGTSQTYRWLENGLHQLDFPILRARPLWDIVVLLLLLAVTISCATGAWLSFTRIGRDFTRLTGRRVPPGEADV